MVEIFLNRLELSSVKSRHLLIKHINEGKLIKGRNSSELPWGGRLETLVIHHHDILHSVALANH